MDNFKIMKLKDFAKEINTPESTVRTWKRRGDIPDYCFFYYWLYCICKSRRDSTMDATSGMR